MRSTHTCPCHLSRYLIGGMFVRSVSDRIAPLVRVKWLGYRSIGIEDVFRFLKPFIYKGLRWY